MINTILTKIFGSHHEREVKKMLPLVAAINEMEAQVKPLSDAELRAKTAEFKTQIENGATLDDLLIPAFAVAREAARRSVHMRHFDVQLMGGMVLHRGQDRRDGHRRGQDAGGHAARLPQRPDRARASTSSPSTTTWPAATPSGWARSTASSGSRSGVIQHDHRPDCRRASAAYRLRHHLRHEQRVRLRLPARQHEVRAGGDGAARPPLRDRRRGRLDPDRRGAHAAHHLRPVRGVDRQVLPHRPHHPPPEEGRGDRRGQARQEEHHRRLHRRREGAHR